MRNVQDHGQASDVAPRGDRKSLLKQGDTSTEAHEILDQAVDLLFFFAARFSTNQLNCFEHSNPALVAQHIQSPLAALSPRIIILLKRLVDLENKLEDLEK
jgi:hypothetical protein